MDYYSCEDDIRKILTELPSENCCIDYKTLPYEKGRYAEFIKDVLAFLNCCEAAGKSKYIIIGVNANGMKRTKIGLKEEKPMQDDNEYQNLINKIKPRPTVHTGTLKFEDKSYGYVYISASNNDRPYELGVDYNEPGGKSFLYGTSWIRKGSQNYSLARSDREAIAALLINKKPSYLTHIEINSEMLLMAAFVGIWDERRDGDKALIEKMTGVSYDDWIKDLQRLRVEGDSLIQYKDGVWLLEGHLDFLQSNSVMVFNKHIDAFITAAKKLMLTYDPKFELESGSRFAAAVYGVKPAYSDAIYVEFSKTMAMLGFKEAAFCNCSRGYILRALSEAVSDILTVDDWKVWATLECSMKYIAQAAPRAFLAKTKAQMQRQDGVIGRLFNERDGLFPTHHAHGLVSALQILAWSRDCFADACDCLFDMRQYSDEIVGRLTEIMTPWHPQTEAGSESRTGYVKGLAREYGRQSWEVIYNLMPGMQLTGMMIDPPEYLPGDFSQKAVTSKEYFNDCEKHLEALIIIAKDNHDLASQLVRIIPYSSDSMIGKTIDFFETLWDETDDQIRYELWNELLTLIRDYKYGRREKRSISGKLLRRIEEIAAAVKPKESINTSRRLFQREQYRVMDPGDYQASKERLHREQLKALSGLYGEGGIERILELIQATEDTGIIGSALAGVKLSGDDVRTVLLLLDSADEKLCGAAKYYCWASYLSGGDKWLEQIGFISYPAELQLAILCAVPISGAILAQVSVMPESFRSDYWKQVSDRFDQSAATNDTVKSLLAAGRPAYALEMLSYMVNNAKNTELGLVYSVLNAITELPSQLSGCYVAAVFNWLHNNETDIEKLSLYEWKYYDVLKNDRKAKSIEYQLSVSPEYLMFLLSMAYKSTIEGALADKWKMPGLTDKMISRAFAILKNWQWAPGVQRDGTFDSDKLNGWFRKVKELSAECGRYDIAMTKVGQVLYYTPAAADGFFIQDAAAQILDLKESGKMRSGYNAEVFNSQGARFVDTFGDEERIEAEKWSSRAQQAETRGYVRFAGTLRDIAREWLAEIEYFRD